MPIKTILVHVADDDHCRHRLETVATLARRFTAFVKALYVSGAGPLPPTAQARADQRCGQAEEYTHRVLCDISFSWDIIHGHPLDRLTTAAAYADLAVISQSTAGGHGATARGASGWSDQLALYIPCPALILPRAMRDDLTATLAPTIGRHVLIAWRNTREAAMAVRAALPFLAQAERVTILTIDSRRHKGPVGEERRQDGDLGDDGRELLVFLERHGIPSQHQAHPGNGSGGRHGDVGATILDRARELGCDLLVMGAYGRSRLREVVFGGATRTVMREATMPIFTAH